MTSVPRAALGVFLSVAAAALIACFGLARNDPMYLDSTEWGRANVLWTFLCGTEAAQKVSILPGACLGHPDCTPLECCPPECHADPNCTAAKCCPPASDGRVRWLSSIAEDNIIPPDVLDARWNYNASLTEGTDQITVWCLFTSLDFSFYTATLFCSVGMWGRFDNKAGLLPSRGQTNRRMEHSAVGKWRMQQRPSTRPWSCRLAPPQWS